MVFEAPEFGGIVYGPEEPAICVDPLMAVTGTSMVRPLAREAPVPRKNAGKFHASTTALLTSD